MTSVTPAFLKAMARAAGLSMTDDGRVISRGSCVYRVPARPDGTVSGEDHLAAIDWFRATQADHLSLMAAYAETIRADELGVLGLAIRTSPDLRHSLRLIERYFRLVTDTAVYRLEETRQHAHFVLAETSGAHPAAHFRTECALAAFARNIRRFTHQRMTFCAATFRHECRSKQESYADYFGCDVRFGAERDMLVMPVSALSLPNRIGDPAVSDYFVRHLQAELDRRMPGPDLRHALLRHVSRSLKDGLPQAADTARAMGMSERTLYRRLADQGLTFREVVRQAQEKLACELLSANECSIAEIAFLTGFSEQSTFSRAFKRWAGQAPAQYRTATWPA